MTRGAHSCGPQGRPVGLVTRRTGAMPLWGRGLLRLVTGSATGCRDRSMGVGAMAARAVAMPSARRGERGLHCVAGRAKGDSAWRREVVRMVTRLAREPCGMHARVGLGDGLVTCGACGRDPGEWTGGVWLVAGDTGALGSVLDGDVLMAPLTRARGRRRVVGRVAARAHSMLRLGGSQSGLHPVAAHAGLRTRCDESVRLMTSGADGMTRRGCLPRLLMASGARVRGVLGGRVWLVTISARLAPRMRGVLG